MIYSKEGQKEDTYITFQEGYNASSNIFSSQEELQTRWNAYIDAESIQTINQINIRY